jgi:hypothetical protein
MALLSFTVNISPHCRNDLNYPTNPEITKVGGMDEVINSAKFDVDQLIGAGLCDVMKSDLSPW